MHKMGATVARIDRLVKQSNDLLSVAPYDTVEMAAAKMTDHHVGSMLVLDENNELMGIITERDILSKVTAKGRDAAMALVEDVMTIDVITCDWKTSITYAQRVMSTNHIRHLPIYGSDGSLGMVSSRDMMAFRLAEARAKLQNQDRLLRSLERAHPGITELQADESGRVTI